ALPVHGDIEQVRRRGGIVIPQVVMNELIVPDSFPGLRVKTEKRIREQIVAEPMPSVIVGRGRVQRDVDVPQFLIGTVNRPATDLSRVRPRVPLPGLVAELPRPRNGIERPFELSRARIPGARIARYLLFVSVITGDRSWCNDR